jgi:hypothetical protein
LEKEITAHNSRFALCGVIPKKRDKQCKHGALCFYSSLPAGRENRPNAKPENGMSVTFF